MSALEKKGKQKIMEKGNTSENAIAIANGNGNENFVSYPQPLAKYTDVIYNKETFMQTLGKLHAAMKTKFMVPIIGGKELDLHQLFKEVTSRGGIDKVIEQRRWREVTASFSFPSTATNASFILRKYYYSLLLHYEQLYYFGSNGFNSHSNDNASSPTTPNPSRRPLAQDPNLQSNKRKATDAETSTTMPAAAYPTVVGIIDGKFEHGYFVTVTVGTQKLRGVLYHCTSPLPPLSLEPPQPVFFRPGPGDDVSARRAMPAGEGKRRRRKKRLSKMDPNHPKPNRSGYNFFFAEQHARLKPLHPGKDREISRMIGELWNSLSEHDKDVYQQRGRVDKERYQNELMVYREKQKNGSTEVIRDAVPLDQRPGSDSGAEMTVQGVDMKIQEGNLVLYNNEDENHDDSFSDGMEDSEEDEEDKSQDMDSENSVGESPVLAESGSVDVAGSSGEKGVENNMGFEIRMREMDVDVPAVIEGALKSGEEINDKLAKGVDFNDKLVEGEAKLGEDLNVKFAEEGPKLGTELGENLVVGESNTGIGFGNLNPVVGDLKMVDAEVSNVAQSIFDA